MAKEGKRDYKLRPNHIKEKCKTLRRKGFSYKQISGKMNIPKTTIYDWTGNINLSKKARERIKNIIKNVLLKVIIAQKGFILEKILPSPKNGLPN